MNFLSVSDYFVGLALKGLKTCCVDIEKYISRLLNCSTDKNLDFNTTQTKFMLLTMAQMKACHKFDTRPRNQMYGKAIGFNEGVETFRC